MLIHVHTYTLDTTYNTIFEIPSLTWNISKIIKFVINLLIASTLKCCLTSERSWRHMTPETSNSSRAPLVVRLPRQQEVESSKRVLVLRLMEEFIPRKIAFQAVQGQAAKLKVIEDDSPSLADHQPCLQIA